MADVLTPRPSVDTDRPVVVARSPRTHVDSTPIPTDSMVTVSLSEASDQERQEHRSLESEPATPDTEASLDGMNNVKQIARARSSSFIIGHPSYSSTDTLAKEMPTTTVIPPTPASVQPRSRSSTNGSSDSNRTVEVDWEELDKTEEQEAKDDASDEVSLQVNEVSLTASGIFSFSSASFS